MIQEPGLKVSKFPSTIKAVNSQGQPVSRICYGANFKVGE